MSSEVLTAPVPCPPDWPLVRMRQIARKVGSGATPTGGQAAYQPTRSNFALIRSQNVFGRAFSEAGLAFISDAQAEALKNVNIEPHDLLLNITGDGVTFGRVCMVPQAVLPACVNQHVSIIRLDSSKADPGYVLSYLTHPAVKEYIEAFNAGGSRRAITKAHIESFVLPLPPLAVQRSIAHVLTALDDRIALLRETNATLEAIAQALFKSWFVDFDPVRAKSQGLAPAGMDEATAALFPDSFEESALGLVPKGWHGGALDDLADLNSQSWSGRHHPERIRYLDLANVKDNEVAVVADFAFDDAPSRARRVLRSGDTIVGTVRPGNRSFAYIHKPVPGLTASSGFAVLSPKVVDNTAFVYLAATQDASIEHLSHVADGGAYPAVRPDVVSALACVVPSAEILRTFNGVTCPLLVKVSANQQQAQTLATLRDTLLPRLISGQLRLPEALAAMEEVA